MSERFPMHLDHVALRVPDPEASAAYYVRVLGLGVTGRDASGGGVLLSALPTGAEVVPHHELVLYPGEAIGLDHYALAVESEAALVATALDLRRRGALVEGPRDFESVHGPSVRLRDADGLWLELVVSEKPIPRPPVDVPANLLRLSHINLKATDPAASARWWQDVMGLRLSDEIPQQFYWLRCNSEHATIALVRSGAPGVHHIAFEIASWEDIRRMLDHFFTAGVTVEFGPGRHGPGFSLFVYFVDPWGIRWELQGEPATIRDETTYRPGVWDPLRGRVGAVNLWGPRPPESFIRGERP